MDRLTSSGIAGSGREQLSAKGLLDKDRINDKLQTIKKRTRVINGVWKNYPWIYQNRKA